MSTSGDRPSARFAHKMVSVPGQNKLLLFGGYESKNGKFAENKMYALDTKSNTWSAIQ